MQLKTLVYVLLIPVLLSSCSILGQRQVEVVTKPVQIDIAQPSMPRPIDLKEPKWYVVSDAKIVEACLKNPETGKSDCKLGREDKYPDGYTYLDKFIDDIKKKHGGDIVFVAMSVADYELMSYNTAEITRYINQLGEVIFYYRNVTMNDDQLEAIGIKVEEENE